MSADHPAVLHSQDADRAHDALGHRHAHKASVKPKPAVTLNVTSMVDILFNLLVYFIVTANFALDEGALKATLPVREAPGHPSQDFPPDGMKHHLDVQGPRNGTTCQLFLDGKAMPDFAALRAALVARRQPPGPPTGSGGGLIHPKFDVIVIRPSPGVRWQHVVNAFNQATGAGYERVGFGQETVVASAR